MQRFVVEVDDKRGVVCVVDTVTKSLVTIYGRVDTYIIVSARNMARRLNDEGTI